MPDERLDPGIPILVAESDPWSKASLRRIFKEFQFTNISYSDDAYKTVHQGRFENFSLLLIGEGLEKGDPLKAISQIRSEGKNKTAPIIFMHDGEKKESAQEATSAGASAAIERPVQEPGLREAIESVLDRYILTTSLEAERNQENASATMSSVQRGQKLMAQGDMEGAEAAFEEAMMTGGGSVEVFSGLAEIYLARGDQEAAEQVLVEAERIDPQARDKFELRDENSLRTGQEALAKGDLEKAEEAFQDALVKGGNGAVDAFCGLAEVDLNRGNITAAERALKEAEKIDPKARDRFKEQEALFVEKGDQLLREKKLEEAETAFQAAVVVNENSVAGNIGLGEVCKEKGDDQAASEAFEKALAIDEAPKDLHVYNKMGITARKDKNYGIALRSFDRALSFDPQDPILYYNKSLVYVAQSQFNDCLPLLEKALELKPDFVQANQARKKVLQAMGN